MDNVVDVLRDKNLAHDLNMYVQFVIFYQELHYKKDDYLRKSVFVASSL